MFLQLLCVWLCLHRCPSCVQLAILAEEKESLLELWEVRRQQYEQCMDLQLFYRDTEQVDNWMSKQEVRASVSRVRRQGLWW